MPKHPAQQGIQLTLMGILVNFILAIIKAVTGFFGNSYAMVADAIESTSDIFVSLVAWVGLRISSKPADYNHPYGHGKAEPITAIAVSLALFGAAIIIIVQSTKRIMTPHPAPAPFTLAVLIVVIAVKEIWFRVLSKAANSTRSTIVKTDAWHHRSDAITSFAAFMGISIALIGGPGYEKADGWAALFASGVIIFNAFMLMRPAIAELMDEALSPEIEQDVRKTAKSVQGVVNLDKCYVRKVGFDYYVDLHVIVNGKISVKKGHEISHNVKDAVRASNPRIANVLAHIEPDKR